MMPVEPISIQAWISTKSPRTRHGLLGVSVLGSWVVVDLMGRLRQARCEFSGQGSRKRQEARRFMRELTSTFCSPRNPRC